MIDPKFVLLGAAFSLAGATTYSVKTLRGQVHPNRVTWLLWALAPLIAFAAQLSSGVGLRSVLAASVGVGPALVFLASLSRRGTGWQLTRFDLGCGAMSVLALVLWGLTGSGQLAIWLSIVSDLMAGLPTLVKALRAPETEHPVPFLAGVCNATITLLTIRTWTFAQYGFPVYILVVTLVLFLLTARGHLRPRGTAARPTSPS